jgi:hypothetical protein
MRARFFCASAGGTRPATGRSGLFRPADNPFRAFAYITVWAEKSMHPISFRPAQAVPAFDDRRGRPQDAPDRRFF